MKYFAITLSLICIGIYILQTIFPPLSELLVLNQKSLAEPWRFVLSIFAHGGIGHLLSNLLALTLFGSLLEKKIESKLFLVVFFSSGIIANIFAFLFYPSSLGASGAIFGILGTLVILQPLMMVWAVGLPMPLILAAAFWVLADVGGLFSESNIGHLAHLGGIAVGFIFGFILRKKYGESKKKENLHIDEQDLRQWEERYLLKN